MDERDREDLWEDLTNRFRQGKLSRRDLLKAASTLGMAAAAYKLLSAVKTGRLAAPAAHAAIIRKGACRGDPVTAALSALAPADPIGALIGQIANGNLRGIVAVIGCVTPRDTYGYRAVTLIRELIARDVEGLLGGKFFVEADPFLAASTILRVIEQKRQGLGLS